MTTATSNGSVTRDSNAKGNEMNVYLIEKCGDVRQCFGPLALDRARREAGQRYTIATISDCPESGTRMRRGELQVAVATGRVRPVDGTHPSSV